MDLGLWLLFRNYSLIFRPLAPAIGPELLDWGSSPEQSGFTISSALF